MTERDLRTRSKQLRSKHPKGDVEANDPMSLVADQDFFAVPSIISNSETKLTNYIETY